MKIKYMNDMATWTTSAAERSQRSTGCSLSTVWNLLGVIAGGAVALAGLMGWGGAPVFFGGVAGAFFCLDAVRQSW